MLRGIRLAAFSAILGTVAIAAEGPPFGSYANYAGGLNSEAAARQERFYERSERIAVAAIASICTGCFELRHQRQEPSKPIDTTQFVAANLQLKARRTTIPKTQASIRATLIAGLIRD